MASPETPCEGCVYILVKGEKHVCSLWNKKLRPREEGKGYQKLQGCDGPLHVKRPPAKW